MYVVTYKGQFGFIKPWTAVRDGETFSQQFLTPSIIEGIEKKLFPELLNVPGIHKILRHKLKYDSLDSQQEVTQPRGWEYKNRTFIRNRSVLKRSVLLHPVLCIAFEKWLCYAFNIVNCFFISIVSSSQNINILSARKRILT